MTGSAPSKIDLVLQRLANISQVGVLALAIFGYFYTVLPFYKLATTEEELSKKALDLAEVDRQLQRTKADLDLLILKAQKDSERADRQLKQAVMYEVLTSNCGFRARINSSAMFFTCVKNQFATFHHYLNRPFLTEDEIEKYTSRLRRWGEGRDLADPRSRTNLIYSALFLRRIDLVDGKFVDDE